MNPAIGKLNLLLAAAAPALSAIEQPRRAPAPGKWSQAQELGHLIDSAINNYRRLILAQTQDRPLFEPYGQDAWVAMGAYDQADWADLVSLWLLLNRQILRIALEVAPEGWHRSCRTAWQLAGGQSGEITLSDLFQDYVAHAEHHVAHILGHEAFAQAQGGR